MCGFCRKDDDEAAVITPDGIVESEEVLRLKDETYYSAFSLWADWKRFGLPHGRGYLHERPIVINALRLVDAAYQRVENWKMEKLRARR